MDTVKPDPHDISDVYLTRTRAAIYVKCSTKTLERLAVDGDGPPMIRLGKRRVAYAKADLDAWMRSRTFKSNAHEAATREQRS
ncbi:AlpA family phage regulatory protein [Roseomonas sp. JC162]|uniref:AlpA family phage regulatory protein n=1 Tax=Neoroseomonas marina TaxID=1232220 RepID=A0A848EHB8_9PROT|nr:helix-turn-helix domain-containing protein [Neoroseomonas marina]NMJ42823.1 AlpA family phage regulatory protein [Neoroseomonas marina]